MSLLGKAMIVAAAATALSCMGSSGQQVDAKAGLRHEPARCRLYFGCIPIVHKPGDSVFSDVK